MKAPKMNLKKVDDKYKFDCMPKYKDLSKIKPSENKLIIPLTKCKNEIIDRLEIIPYNKNISATKLKFKLFYYDVESNKKFIIDIFFENECTVKFFFNKVINKYWKLIVKEENGNKVDEHTLGTSISRKLEEILGNDCVTKKNIITLLEEFNYKNFKKLKNMNIEEDINVNRKNK